MTRFRRIIIYPQDVSIITGKSDRYGRMLLNKIKAELGKKKHQYLTIKEFAEYMAIDQKLVEEVIFGLPN